MGPIQAVTRKSVMTIKEEPALMWKEGPRDPLMDAAENDDRVRAVVDAERSCAWRPNEHVA